MSEHSLGTLPSDRSNGDAMVIEPVVIEPIVTEPILSNAMDEPRRRATDRAAADTVSLTRFEQEQLAREYADIERASAALRLGQPALQSWNRPAAGPAAVAKKPRSLWLVIGILWLSTAVITVGAVAAIASLVG